MPTARVALVAFLIAFGTGLSSSAEASLLITIDKASQRMSVSVDGRQRYSWPVSTGRAGYATPAGSYKPFRMEADHYSKEWDEAPMPHSIFFTKTGHAIHGSFDVRRLGSPASHGCVRLAPANAATLFSLVTAEGLDNTRVVLSGEERVRSRAPRLEEAALPDRPRARRQPLAADDEEQPVGWGRADPYFRGQDDFRDLPQRWR